MLKATVIGHLKLLLAFGIAILPFANAVANANGYFPMFAAWPQPQGAGTQITLTYSYINLLDGSIINSDTGEAYTPAEIRGMVEAAFQDYALHLPIDFVEISDSGPAPNTGSYPANDLANIRIGQVPSIDNANAFAYFPIDPSAGLSGDIVFNASRFGNDWSPLFFYIVTQHEIGHSLGMGHFVSVTPRQLGEEFEPTEQAFAYYTGPRLPLLPGMVTALQGAYGAGVGSVTPIPIPVIAPLWTLICLWLFLQKRYRGCQ